MVLNLKFKPLPKGTDAVYVYVPGLIDSFYIRPDWKEANYIIMAAITYLGKRGHTQRASTGGKERVVITCNLADFIFEPFPTAMLENVEDIEPEEKVINLSSFARKRKY